MDFDGKHSENIEKIQPEVMSSVINLEQDTHQAKLRQNLSSQEK